VPPAVHASRTPALCASGLGMAKLHSALMEHGGKSRRHAIRAKGLLQCILISGVLWSSSIYTAQSATEGDPGHRSLRSILGRSAIGLPLFTEIEVDVYEGVTVLFLQESVFQIRKSSLMGKTDEIHHASPCLPAIAATDSPS